ncbi:hypothetical protein UFOVP344_32 [uncultured Caudovirales phage]|uniref:Uncharacterized protein n=1 Tax=uncultured Caudovirales phage TaxID=2100421 RepID=A0A6J5M186_9CAUD|nr:hypothetical protein UFOVP344_32 [uncultured Caudovirales phage]
MRKLQIDGVGAIEVDPSFDSMSPEEKEATINEIVAAKGKAPKGPPAAPRPDQQTVTAAKGGFLTADANAAPPPPPGKRSIFTPEEEANIQAFVEEGVKNKTLTPETYQQFLSDLSGGELGDPDPKVTVDNFYKSGWGGTEYFDTATENKPKEELDAKLAANPERFNDAGTFGMAALDALPFNFGTEIRAGADTLLTETFDPTDPDFFNFWNPFKGKYADYRAKAEQRAAEDPLLNLSGEVLGSIAQPTARFGIRNPGPLRGAVEGGVIGGVSGIGMGEGSLYDRLDEGATGAAIGVPLGAGSGFISSVATKGRRDDRWVDKVLKQEGENTALPYVPEVADDLYTVVNGSTQFGKKTTPAGRSSITVKQVNDLEDRYLSDVGSRIEKLDIPPSQKRALAEAIRGKHSLDGVNIEFLRGTPEGDFVANAITKTQTLRKMTPEVPRSVAPEWVKDALSLGTGAGMFAADGGLMSVVAPIITRRVLGGMGNTEAARVNSADKVIKNIDRYRKLGERVGPSPYQSSRDAFMNMTDEAMDMPYLLKKQKEAEDAAEAASRQEMNAGLYGSGRPITNDDMIAVQRDRDQFPFASQPVKARKQDMENLGDLIDTTVDGPQSRALASEIDNLAADDVPAMQAAFDDAKGAYDELLALKKDIYTPKNRKTEGKAALDKLEAARQKSANRTTEAIAKFRTRKGAMSPEDFLAKLEEPLPAPKGPKPPQLSGLDLTIQQNIEAGIRGNSGVQKAFADRVGVNNDDMLRALDKVATDVPQLADDIQRIKFGYPTKTKKGVADALVPRMKKVLEEDGTLEGYRAKAAEAQAREEAMRKVSGAEAPKAEAKPASPKRAAEGNMIGISRPEQWEQGKGRYIEMADEATSRFYQDITVPEEAYKAIGNAPDVIKNKYKTTQEAREFINENVVEDLRIKGVSPEDIAKVKTYLFEIAEAKPYDTPEALKKGTQKLASTK